MALAKRYEVYLPLKYTDGRLVEAEKFSLLEDELVERLGGLTSMQQDSLHALRGFWKHKGQIYQDEIVVLTVYAFAEVEHSDDFWRSHKTVLKERFPS